MDVIQVDDSQSESQSSGLESNDGFEVKIEFDDAVKSEPFESDHDRSNTNPHQLEALQTLVDEIPVLDESSSDDKPKTQEFLDFEREIPEFHVTDRIEEVKMEADEIVIKDETEETDDEMQEQQIEDQSDRSSVWPHSHYETEEETLTDVEMYSCRSCDFRSLHEASLYVHTMRNHIEDAATHMCPHCSFWTKKRDNFQRHLLGHLGITTSKEFRCDVCDHQAGDGREFTSHMLSHVDKTMATTFSCHHCSHRTVKLASLKLHVRKCHGSAPAIVLRCDQCGYRTIDSRNFKRHGLVHMKESDVEMFSCRSCEFRTKHKTCLIRHERKRHQNDNDDGWERQLPKPRDRSPEDELGCDLCDYRTTCKHDFKKHVIEVHAGEEAPKFSCSHCGVRYKQKCALTKHLLWRHSDAPTFRCHLCDFQCNRMVDLKQHARKHDKTKTCEVCGAFRYRHLKQLRQHRQQCYIEVTEDRSIDPSDHCSIK